MHHELVNGITRKIALNFQLINANTTTVGNIIDTQGLTGHTFVFATGVLTDGDYLPLIEEDDAAGGGTMAAVADSDLIGTEAGAGWTADGDDNKWSKIGYKGSKRYIRCSIVSTNNGGSGATLGAIYEGMPTNAPDSTQKS
jgi:hypothetical protein